MSEEERVEGDNEGEMSNQGVGVEAENDGGSLLLEEGRVVSSSSTREGGREEDVALRS